MKSLVSIFLFLCMMASAAAVFDFYEDVKSYHETNIVTIKNYDSTSKEQLMNVLNDVKKLDVKTVNSAGFASVNAGIPNLINGLRSRDPYKLSQGVLTLAAGITGLVGIPIAPVVLKLVATLISASRKSSTDNPMSTALDQFRVTDSIDNLKATLQYAMERIVELGNTANGDKEQNAAKIDDVLAKLKEVKHKFDKTMEGICKGGKDNQCVELIKSLVTFRTTHCALIMSYYAKDPQDMTKMNEELKAIFEADYKSLDFLLDPSKMGNNWKIFISVMKTPGNHKEIYNYVRRIIDYYKNIDYDKNVDYENVMKVVSSVYICSSLDRPDCAKIDAFTKQKESTATTQTYQFTKSVVKKAIFVPYNKEIYIKADKSAEETGPYRGMALYSSKKKLKVYTIRVVEIQPEQETVNSIRICTAHNWCDNVYSSTDKYHAGDVLSLDKINGIKMAEKKLQSIWVPEKIKVKLYSESKRFALTIVGPQFVNNLKRCSKKWESIEVISADVQAKENEDLVRYCSQLGLQGICLQSIPNMNDDIGTAVIYQRKFSRQCKFDPFSIFVPESIQLVICYDKGNKAIERSGPQILENLQSPRGSALSKVFSAKALVLKTRQKNLDDEMKCPSDKEWDSYLESMKNITPEDSKDEEDQKDQESVIDDEAIGEEDSINESN